MRLLHKEELEALEQEFVSYLIMNGIEGKEWEKILQNDSFKADQIIEEFSYKYFDVMLDGIEYIWMETAEILHTLHFRGSEVSELILLKSNNEIAHRESSFQNDRKKDLFILMEQGFLPDRGEKYKELALLFAAQ